MLVGLTGIEHVEPVSDLEDTGVAHGQLSLLGDEDRTNAVPRRPRLGDGREYGRAPTLIGTVASGEEQPPALTTDEQARVAGCQGVLLAPLDHASVADPASTVAGGGHVQSGVLAVTAAVGHEVPSRDLHYTRGLDPVAVAISREPGVDSNAETVPTMVGLFGRSQDPTGALVVTGIPHAKGVVVVLNHPWLPGPQAVGIVGVDR